MSGQYVVVKVNSDPMGFTKFHDTKELAIEEGKRLCKKTGSRFLILKVIGYCDKPETPIEFKEVE